MARDAMGKDVPPRLEDTFNGRLLLMTIAEDIELIRRRLGALTRQACCDCMDVPQLRLALHRMQMTILQDAPFTECNCPPTKQCSLCKGRKWISATQFLKASTPPPQLTLSD